MCSLGPAGDACRGCPPTSSHRVGAGLFRRPEQRLTGNQSTLGAGMRKISRRALHSCDSKQWLHHSQATTPCIECEGRAYIIGAHSRQHVGSGLDDKSSQIPRYFQLTPSALPLSLKAEYREGTSSRLGNEITSLDVYSLVGRVGVADLSVTTGRYRLRPVSMEFAPPRLDVAPL